MTCAQCHVSTSPPTWNAFGTDIFAHLGGARVDEGLLEALMAIETRDSDEDGVSNRDEIAQGTLPGDPASNWEELDDPGPVHNPAYPIGEYDLRLALRRVRLLYCGHSPTYEEQAAFAAKDPDDQRKALHAALDE